MFCEKCGANIGDNEQFCSACGAEVGKIENQDETPVTEENAEQQTTPVEQEESTTEDTVDSVETENIYCTNCGSALSADEVFCSVCGTRTSVDAGESLDEEKAPKSLKSKKLFVIAAALVIVVLLGTIVAKAYPYVSNAIMKTAMSPENYFVSVVDNSFDDISDNVTKIYSNALNNMEGDKGAKGEISFSLKDNVSDIIYDISGEDVSEYIDWFESAAITYDASVKNSTLSKVNLGVKLNKVDLGDINVITDMENMEMFMGIPDYNPDYIYVDMEDMYGYGYNPYQDMSEMMSTITEALPDDKLLNTLLRTYVKEIAKSVDDVEKSSEKLEADGVSQKVTVLSAQITEETVYTAGKNILSKAIEDKNFKKLIEGLENIEDADINYDDIIEAMESTLEDMEEYDDYYSDEVVNLDVYVDGKGEILGFAVTYEDDYSSFDFSSYTIKKGSKTGTYIGFDAGMVSASIEGKGKESFGKSSGEYILTVAGNDVAVIELKGVDIKKSEEGILNGSVTIKPADDANKLLRMAMDSDAADLISDMALVIKSGSSSLNDAKYNIILQIEGKDLAELTISAKTQNSGKISIPSDYVDMNDYDAQEEFTDNFDFDALIEKLEKANIPDEAIEELEYSLDY